MSTTTKKMTVDEFYEYAARHGRCELINGEVRTMTPASDRHGELALRLGAKVFNFADDNDLGKAVAAETGFVLDADENTIRAPDLAFTRKERAVRTNKFSTVIPDLIAEVLSLNDRAGEVNEKIEQWFAAGVRVAWIVDPETSTVTVRHPDGAARVLHLGDTLTGDDVLPGFELPLGELFK